MSRTSKHKNKLEFSKKMSVLKKASSTMAIITFLTANTSVMAFAKTQDDVTKNKKMPSCLNINPYDKNMNTTREGNSIGRRYTFEYLNKLNYQDLVSLIKKIPANDVDNLFKFSKESYEFFNNSDRVQALIDGLYSSAYNYTDKNNEGIPTLVEFLRAGFYLGYYNKELSYLNDINFKNRCLPAIKAMENNVFFKFGTYAQDSVISALGKLISNASIDSEGINGTTKIFDQFYSNLKTYSTDNIKSSALYNVMNGIDYFTNTIAFKNHYNVKNTSLYKNIDPYILRLDWFSLAKDYMSENNEWLFTNSIYYDSRISVFRSDPNITRTVLTKATKIYPYLGPVYFEAINGLINNFKSIDSDGNKIDLNKIKEDGKEKYLPKTYTFDDSNITVKAGDKVSVEKIKRLYWASKEVKAQFLRVVGRNYPVDKNKPENKLNIVIYNSPSEYKLNRNLYGYTTDNGGIYIEPVQTFFTYERTPEESIYTLEELFRHEFTHYLQGKYVVPGMWGQGPFYPSNGGELTWYDEGTAEFFAGSTRTNNIQPRKSIIGNLAPNIKDRMPLDKLLHIHYGTWDFYNYGCAFASYMYNNNIEMFQNMNKFIEDNNEKGYSEYVDSICNNSNIKNQYEDYISKLINELPNLSIPLVSDDYLKPHPYKQSEEVFNKIKEVSNLKDMKTNKEKSEYFETFDLSGTYEGDKSLGKTKDWENMNKKLNEILLTLNKESWSGYKTITAYFTDYKVENGKYNYTLHFHGMLNDKNKENILPTAIINAPKSANVGKSILFDGSNSKDKDGQIVSYLWDFGDGTTSDKAKVKHEFKKEGTYNIKLKVTDNTGHTNTSDINLKVNKEKPCSTISEIEPNNEFKTANNILKPNTPIKGSVSNSDNCDTFSFNVLKDGPISIKLDDINKLGLNWLVYKASNLNDYAYYPKKSDNNILEGNFNMSKGKYYIKVYKANENRDKGNYTLTIDGALLESKSLKTIEGKKDNNSIEKAMKINLNTNINSFISSKDKLQVYEIDVKKDSDLNIDLENFSDTPLNWLLYSFEDMNNYVSYANINGNELNNIYKAKKGKYYLYVYKTSSGKGDYNLKITD